MPSPTIKKMPKTPQHPYEKTLKSFLKLLGLFILAPTVLSFGFKALKIYKTAPNNLIAYTLTAIGGILIMYTLYFGFKTIQLLLDTLFRK